MKRIISLILVLLMLLPLVVACKKKDELPEESDSGTESITPDDGLIPPLIGTTYPLTNTATWVKKLDPRMEAGAESITCDWSASGIEFTATCKGNLFFEVKAETFKGGGVYGCYFRAYVDGVAHLNDGSPYYEIIENTDGKSYVVLRDIPDGTHTIKLVKATGYTLANVDLLNVTVDGTVGETAPADCQYLLEFVGDSICCGWGVMGSYGGAYTDQDATLAYPYLVATALGADYSVVALSGQGIIKGNPGIGNGYKYASPYRSKATEYDFARKADVIVINADTNDAYDQYSEEQYKAALSELVTYAREKNGADAHIILACNMMKETYSETIRKYVIELGGAAEGYYYYKPETAAGVHSAHPSADEHQVYAAELKQMIGEILDGSYEEPDLNTAFNAVIPDYYDTLYRENFDGATSLSQAGITPLYGAAPSVLLLEDGKLVIPSNEWKNALWTIIDNDAVKTFPKKYTVRMDLDITELSVFCIAMNTENDGKNWQQDRRSGHYIQLRNGQAGTKGALSAYNDLWFRAGYFTDDSEAKQTDLINIQAYDIPDKQKTAQVSLAIQVNGNRVDVFIDNVWIGGYSVPKMKADCSIKDKSSVILWAQESSLTVDNLEVIVASKDYSEMVTYPLNDTATWVKSLDPRMEATAEYITCDWSAAGVEFTGEFKGENVVFRVNATDPCYFRAYVDGVSHLNDGNPYYTASAGESTIYLSQGSTPSSWSRRRAIPLPEPSC